MWKPGPAGGLPSEAQRLLRSSSQEYDRDVSDPELVALPVGFERFHRRDFINYQLNRAHALGFADRDELLGAATSIRRMDDCAAVFEGLSNRAAAVDRHRQAAGYARIAEFFTPPRSVEKTDRYRQIGGYIIAHASAFVGRRPQDGRGMVRRQYV